MMRKLVLFMHVSLDGFTARPNGDMDWIHVDNELFRYAGQRTREADSAIYGRVTFQLMDNYWPTAADQPNATRHDKEHSAWYNQVNKIVVSKSMKDASLPNTTIISNELASNVKALKKEQGKEIIMFGSPSVARQLMTENLVDDYWLFVNPILLGQGIPLFGSPKIPIELMLEEIKKLDSGVVCLHYKVK